MVLENLFPSKLLEKKYSYAFFLAVVYTLLSLLLARFIFPSNSGLVSVVFITILLMPYLEKLIAREEKVEEKERKFTLSRLWIDNRSMIKVYACLFFGVFLTYSLMALLLPWIGVDMSVVFGEQLHLDAMAGSAFDTGVFSTIFLNNWWVLLAVFLIALIAGEGTLFFIVWNASVWGAIFGFRSFASAITMGTGFWGSLLNFLLLALVVTPHLLLETGAYLLAGISGEVLSDDIMKKMKNARTFVFMFLLLLLFYLVLVFAFKTVLSVFAYTLLNIFMALGAIYLLKFLFDNKKQKEVFVYNYWLFFIAVLIFVLGALIETSVLMNSDILHNIYNAAFVFLG